MRIREWRIGTRDVFVNDEIVAVLIGVGELVEVWEFDNDRMMTTGKCFGMMTMEEIECKYGPLENDKLKGQVLQMGSSSTASGVEQLTLFEKRCDCGAEVDVIQFTIDGEDYFCHACYSRLTDEKEEAS